MVTGQARRRGDGKIRRLWPEEAVRLDRARVLQLYADLGDALADAVVCRTAEDLAVGMVRLRDLAAEPDPAAVQHLAQRLAAVADDVGMTHLAQVMGSVGDAASAADMPALSATLARLARIGDRSLTAVWDLQDMMP